MPSLPHFAPLAEEMAQALVESPLRVTRRVRLAAAPEPVQPLREIRASGFDAIVEVTDRAMREAVRRHLGTTLRVPPSPLPPDLGEALSLQLEELVASHRREEPVIAWPPSLERVLVELEPSSLRASVSVSKVAVSGGTTPRATVSLAVHVSVVATETAASHARRVDFDSFRRAPPPFRGTLPVGAESPAVAEILAGSTVLDVSAPVLVRVDRSRYAIDAELNFAGAELRAPRDGWGAAVTALVGPRVRSAGRVALVPGVRLFGEAPDLPVPEAARFDVQAVAMPANRVGQTLLAFCIETLAGTSAPEVAAVGAFTGNGNVACFCTAPVIRGALLARWRSLPRRVLERTVPIVIQREGRRVEASARVRYELGEAVSASLDYGSDLAEDGLIIAASYLSQALSARLRGEDVSASLGPLTTPRRVEQLFRLQPGAATAPFPDETLEDWLHDNARHVVAPLLRPFASPWQLRADFDTQVSAPLTAMLTRGTLQ